MDSKTTAASGPALIDGTTAELAGCGSGRSGVDMRQWQSEEGQQLAATTLTEHPVLPVLHAMTLTGKLAVSKNESRAVKALGKACMRGKD